MGTLELRRVINHSAKDIWPLIKDFRNVHKILPMISHATLTSKNDCGLNAERVCYMQAGGFALHERVIDWNEGESYTIEIYQTTMPMMRRSTTSLGVVPLSANTSEVFFESQYELKYGFFGKLVDKLMINFMMKRMIAGLFIAIDKEVSSLKSSPSESLVEVRRAA